ncbi:MAG: aldo/keto reductase [Planctomycetota bacterium]
MIHKLIGLFKPRRALGGTGFKATRIGIGDLADRKVALATCVATVHRAMDAGLNVIDTAPMYEDGYSEQIVGAAVKGRRERMFVIDKVDRLEAPVALQVNASLKRMKLDHTDCFLFHAVDQVRAWRWLAAPGGGMDQLGACVRQGKTRFRGISSHNPAVLTAAIGSGLCDAVMFPLGPNSNIAFVREVLPLARRHGVGAIGIKAFGAGKFLGDTAGYNRPPAVRPRGKFSSGGTEASDAPRLPHMAVEECLGYMLTLDPDVALLGLSYPNEQDVAFDAAAAFRPYSPRRMAAIRTCAATAIRGKGPSWWNP